MSKRWYTMIELIVSITILMGMLLVFFYIIKNTILFVNFHKQETVLLSNINLIKSKININFQHRKIKMLPTRGLSLTGAYSIKDTVVENQKKHIIDTIAFEYEDAISSGSITGTQTGVFVLWIANDTGGKIITPPSSAHGFFTIRHLSGSGNLFDYTINNTNWAVLLPDDYINANVKIQEFRYSLVNEGAYLRIDMTYDNDIDGEYERMGKADEYYFSGATYILKKINMN